MPKHNETAQNGACRLIHDKNSSAWGAKFTGRLPRECSRVTRTHPRRPAGFHNAEPIGNQVPKPVSSGRVDGTRALAYLAVPSVIFGPCGGLYAEHTVAGKVHLRKTEAGRMHSLNVAGIMILLAIVALFVLA